MEDRQSLAGKCYLVTGGSAGIGLALTKALRERGANVVICARDEGRLQAAAEYTGAHPVPGDVGREEDVRRIVSETVRHLGRLDGLINNAALFYGKPVEALDWASFRRLLEVNVMGPAFLVREAVPHLKAAGGGDIVNIGSTAGLRGDPGLSPYVASKFALRGLTQSWQAELRRFNIRVILIQPSEVQTRFVRPGAPAPKPNPYKLFAQDIAYAVLAALEMHPRGFVPEMTVYATNPWGGER